MRLAYLAGRGPIDAVSVDEAVAWRVLWAKDLLSYGIGSYSPVAAWLTSPDRMTRDAMGQVCRVNRAAVKECELFLCHLNGPAWGSLLELELAASLEKRIYIVSAEPLVSYEAWRWVAYPSWASCLDQIVKDLQRPGGAS